MGGRPHARDSPRTCAGPREIRALGMTEVTIGFNPGATASARLLDHRGRQTRPQRLDATRRAWWERPRPQNGNGHTLGRGRARLEADALELEKKVERLPALRGMASDQNSYSQRK